MQSNNINTYEEIIRIPTGEVEPLTVLRPSGILDCFQTVAGIHATVLGLGLRRLLENNHAWVLVRTKYDVYKQIPKESQVIVETWPHVKGAFDYDRDYRILDLDRNVLVKATSKWVIIDTNERKILRSPYDYSCECSDEKTYDSFDKIRVKFDDDSKILGTYTIRNTEIDILGHLNNIRYADIIFEFYPYALENLQIDYINETKLGETLTIKEIVEDDSVFIGGFSKEGQLKFVSKFKNPIN